MTRTALCAAALICTLAAHAAPLDDDLILAVQRNNASAAQTALRLGANPNALDAKGRTALTYAIGNASDRVLPALLQWPSTDINTANANGETPLMMAIIRNDTALAQTLINRGAAINKPGWTPLHYAATRANLPIMRALLEQSAYIDAQSPNLSTPLMMAAQYGNEAAVALLLEQGADPWAKNMLGLSALDFARKSSNTHSQALIAQAQRTQTPQPAIPVEPLSVTYPEDTASAPAPETAPAASSPAASPATFWPWLPASMQ